MKDTILNLYKVAGETPLERIQRFRLENPDFENVKLSYAGRLDPMAEGVLLVLAGEENKSREKYLAYSKEYTFDALFGVKTDTYDILGKVIPSEPHGMEKVNSKSKNDTDNDRETEPEHLDWKDLESKIAHYLIEFKGKISQQYPPYSSRTVKGKPLFQWAREGKISEVDIPSNEVEIYNIGPIYTYKVGALELSAYIFDMISRVRGDFRQAAIVKSWLEFFEQNKEPEFHILRLKISCSSGTYVRGIVNSLGKKLGVGALALKIVRTKIGDYKMEDAVM